MLHNIAVVQGESDAITEEGAAGYSAKLARFIAASRSSLCQLSLPHHAHAPPIILCGIWGSEERVPYKHVVRAAQLAAAADSCRFLSASVIYYMMSQRIDASFDACRL